MRIYILPVLITLLIITSFCSSVYAVDLESSLSASMSAEILPTGNDIGISKITPASFFYFLKTIRENLEMKMALTPHVKQIRLLEFATRRLREAKSLIGIKEDLISPTLERYWFHINSLLAEKHLDNEVTTRLTEGLVVHLEALEQIYSQINNPQAKITVRSIVNRLVQKTNLPKAGLIPACYFLQQAASSSAVTAVEKAILSERAQSCFKRVNPSGM